MNRFGKTIVVCSLLFLIVLFFVDTSVNAATSGLRFQKKSVSLNLNRQERVDIRLENSGNDVIGIDLIIKFDPKYIRVIDIDNLGVFNQQMGENVDNEKGIVRLGLANSFGRYQKSSAAIASLVFETLTETSNTEIEIDFESGGTKDSNVAIGNGLDILTSVENLTVSISKENPSNSSGSSSVKSFETSEEVKSVDINNDNSDVVDTKEEKNVEENKLESEIKSDTQKDGKDYVKEVLGIADEVKSGKNYYPLIIASILALGLIAGFVVGKSYKDRKKLDRVNYK